LRTVLPQVENQEQYDLVLMNNSTYLDERELIKAEIKRLEVLFESSTLNYQCLDAKGNIVKVNSSWLKTLDYSEEDVKNRWFGELLTVDSKNIFKETYDNFCKNQKNGSLELTIICKDGSRIYADFSCICNTAKKGGPLYSHCIFQNITKLRETELALQESEKKYSQLVELSNVGIFEYDVYSDEFTYINKEIKSELGIDPESTFIPDLKQYLTPESLKSFNQRILQFQNGDTIPESAEYQLTNADGKEIWIHLSSSYLNEGEKLRIIGAVQNITARKKMEIELKDYHQRLEQITRNLPAVIFQYTIENGRTVFHYLSENIKDFSGYTADQLKANPGIVSNLIKPQDYQDLSRSIEAGSKKGLPVHLNYQVTTKNGERRWTRTTISPKVIDDKITLWTGISNDITEEVEIKEKLVKTEARYKALVNSAAPGISTMSVTGIVTSVNPRLCEISGYEEDELVGKHFLKIPAFYISDAPKYLKLYSNAKKEIYPDEPELFTWKHKNGEQRWAEAFLSSIKENNKIVGYQAVFTDTTAKVLLQKKEDQRIKEMETLFEAAQKLLTIENEKELFEFLADLLAELIPGSFIVVNSVSEEMDCLTVETVRVHEKTLLARIMKLLENKVSGRKFTITPDTFNYAIEGRLLSYHDSIYELALKQIPKVVCDQIEKLIGLESIYEISMGNTGQIMGGCAILLTKGQKIGNAGLIETLFRDVSSTLVRLRTKKKLDQNERLFRSLAESSGDWIIRFNKEFQHIYVNQSVISSLGKNPQDIIGRRCEQIGYSREYSRIIELRLSETFKTHQATQCDIEWYVDGKSKFYEWKFYPEENLETVIVNARNITERKQVEGRLLDSVSKRNKLYSIISHDLRAPFNSIIGFSDLLVSRYPGLSDDERMKYIKVIDKSSQDCLLLIESILNWSKDYAENDTSKPVYFDLGGLIKKAVGLHQVSILEKEIRTAFSIDENAIVYADYNMIYTVLRNLVSNAIKYSNPGGIIIVSLMEETQTVVCKIEDNGIGMNADMISAILSNKKVSHTTPSSGTSSSGLGLKLTKEFIEYNGGKIWIESMEGKGSSFFFTLPKGP
jgi:PAS domain S-box-containing protein